MRELVLSIGITFLTGTLLFVYFRNKYNSIDKKVNIVFETIQEHNERMQQEAESEMRRFAEYQNRIQMENSPLPQPEEMSEEMSEEVSEEVSNLVETKVSSRNNLIDVSDQEEDQLKSKFESDDESDSDEDSDDESDSDSDEESDENKKILEEVSTDLVIENLEDLGSTEVTLENKVNYNKFTKAQLKKFCEERNLSGYKSYNKSKLVLILENSDASTTINLGA